MSLAEGLARADVLVFLCSGNMVRSAFAELYARHLGCPTPVRSAATTFRNARLFPETEAALSARGVAPEALRAFRPTHLDDLPPSLGGAPLFLGMTRAHLQALRSRRPDAFAALLGELAPGPVEIADPVLEGADFGRTFARVAECVEALVARLGG